MTAIEKRQYEQVAEAMSAADVRRAYNEAEAETEEADLLAGEMERRDLDE